MKVLMVCLGNICRSPLAEGILQHKAQQHGLPWQVDSAGTGNWHVGKPPHRLSQKTALHYGVNIGHQKCRQYRASDMTEFDVIFFMERANLEDARMMSGAGWDASKAKLLLNEMHPGSNMAVPDPYYGTEADYHDVFEMISKACDAFIAKHL